MEENSKIIAGPHSAISRAPDSKVRGPGSILGLATYFCFSLLFQEGQLSVTGESVHEVLVNCLGGLSLPRKSVVRVTDRHGMTLDVYRGRNTTVQQQQQKSKIIFLISQRKLNILTPH